MSKNSDIKKMKADVSLFFSEVNRENPDINKLITIAKNNPDLLKSDEFIKRAFPKCEKKKLANKLGLLKTDKLMKTVGILKQMKEKDPDLTENVNDFMSKNHPSNGENVVTFIAKNAVAAYDKANIDRTPEENLPEADKKILADNYQMYTSQLQNIHDDGFDMKTKNAQGQDISDISNMSVTKDSTGKTPLSELELEIDGDNESKKALKLNTENEGEEIEVEGDKKPLKIKTPEKPAVKVKTDEPTEDEENEAEIVDPPSDRGKAGDSKWEPIQEEDIIKFMYEKWFLRGMDYLMSKATGWLENSVDNLCNELVKKGAAVRAQNKEQKKKRVNDYQRKGLYILNNYPSEMTQQFAEGLKNKNTLSQKINQDIRDNIGKNPQQWNVLNPENKNDKKLIDILNSQYASDPKAFMQTLDNLDNKNSSSMNAMVKMYNLAAQMAVVQFMHKNMKSGKLDLASEGSSETKAKMDKLIQKNLSQIMKAVNGVAEHTKLAYMIRDGEKDMTFIQENSAKAVHQFLELAIKQTAQTKVDLITDLKNGNFKANDKSSQTRASENLKKMEAIIGDGEKYYEKLIPAKQKAGLPVGLETEAHNINVTNIRNGNIRDDIIGNVKDLEIREASAKERKAAFDKYVEKMRNNKDFMNQDSRATNPKEVVASIIASRQRRGNE